MKQEVGEMWHAVMATFKDAFGLLFVVTLAVMWGSIDPDVSFLDQILEFSWVYGAVAVVVMICLAWRLRSQDKDSGEASWSPH